MGSFFRVKRNVILNVHHIGSKYCQDIMHLHLCCGPTNSKPLDLNTANLWNTITKIEKTHRNFSSDSLVPSFGQKSKRGEKPGKRIKIAENGRVYGNLRLISLLFILQNRINLPFLYAYCWYTYVVVVFSTAQVESWSRKKQLGRSSAWWLRRQQRCSVWSPWPVCPRSGLNQSLPWRLGRSKGGSGGISFQWEDFESD